VSTPEVGEVSIEGLPAQARALLDPGAPIPADVAFVARRGEPLGAVLLALIAAFMLLVFSGLCLGLMTGEGPIEGGAWLVLGLFLLAGPGAGCASLLLWARLRRERAARRSGRFRDGLFVLPSGLFFHEAGACRWLPREACVELRFERDWQVHSYSEGVLYYRDAAGALQRQELPEPSGDVGVGLQAWLQAGRFTWVGELADEGSSR